MDKCLITDVAYTSANFLQVLGAETPMEAVGVQKGNHHLP